jgi:hypothetical protein
MSALIYTYALLNLGEHMRPHAGEIKDPAAAYSGGYNFSLGLQIIESASFDAEEPLDIAPPSPFRESTGGAVEGNRCTGKARCGGCPNDLCNGFFDFRVTNLCALAFASRSCG